MSVENPFRSIRLRYWPDYLLVFAGALFMIVFVAFVAGASIPGGGPSWLAILGGAVLFGIAGEKAHYRYYVKIPKANMQVPTSGWLHGIFADTMAGVGLILASGGVISWVWRPSCF